MATLGIKGLHSIYSGLLLLLLQLPVTAESVVHSWMNSMPLYTRLCRDRGQSTDIHICHALAV